MQDEVKAVVRSKLGWDKDEAQKDKVKGKLGGLSTRKDGLTEEGVKHIDSIKQRLLNHTRWGEVVHQFPNLAGLGEDLDKPERALADKQVIAWLKKMVHSAWESRRSKGKGCVCGVARLALTCCSAMDLSRHNRRDIELCTHTRVFVLHSCHIVFSLLIAPRGGGE
jgi:hypothetical protein